MSYQQSYLANPYMPQTQQQSPVMQAIQQAQRMAGGNPQSLFNRMMQSNQQFREFVQEHGIDMGQVSRALGGMV